MKQNEPLSRQRQLTAHSMRQDGKSWREIGEALGVSRERASQIAAQWDRYQRCKMAQASMDIGKLQERLVEYLAVPEWRREWLWRQWNPAKFYLKPVQIKLPAVRFSIQQTTWSIRSKLAKWIEPKPITPVEPVAAPAAA